MHFMEKGLRRKGFRGFQAGAAFAQYYREHFLERYPQEQITRIVLIMRKRKREVVIPEKEIQKERRRKNFGA